LDPDKIEKPKEEVSNFRAQVLSKRKT
jgi:hypothetical protein